MIEYTEVATTSIYQQEIGFTNKLTELVVYRSLAKPLSLYCLLVSAIYGINIMIEVCHDRIYSSG